MNYQIGDNVTINPKNGWGGNFHKCKGVITSLEPDNMFRVEIFTRGRPLIESHSLLCKPNNVLRVA